MKPSICAALSTNKEKLSKSYTRLEKIAPCKKPRHRGRKRERNRNPNRKKRLINQHGQSQSTAARRRQLRRSIGAFSGTLLLAEARQANFFEQRFNIDVVFDGDVEAGDRGRRYRDVYA
ncbi:propionyl-CoA carboxylase beta subunit [Striga asiatica]|uniref:Propionyl-CoA carboxylase beta subunit n=1 Tax=Striga asiatica TaxID=4170 RepID=A0A5A7PTD6_STRAF|nr:propionyl-CoA carboxylase beta subunit [Striga asiatica]